RDRFLALAGTVRDRLIQRWIKTQQTYYKVDAKRVYYLSAEYLVGRSLGNNLINVGLYEKLAKALSDLGIEIDDLLEQEVDAGLGNGGLGRLAACFLDSMATLALPGYGYGIRYEFGIFDQEIRQGFQIERPDEWLRVGNPWGIARPEYAFEVKLGGHTERIPDCRGGFKVRWCPAETVLGVPYDTPIPGYGNGTVNTMRLWRARASKEFDLQVFNAGDYERAVEHKNASESISKVLYPPDHTEEGRELRLKQQYFFVTCSIQDIVRRYLVSHRDFSAFADKVAIQLNDTHPAVAIPELMRVLVDENGVSWEEAWGTTVRTCGYTNHTLLAEALEKWPITLFEKLLPRHLEIIYEINYRFLRDVMNKYPLDHDRIARMSIVEEGQTRQIRMAHLAVVGSHAINGVAELHTKLLKERLLTDFHDFWPERFTNKTNGVTPRRWLRLSNPRLAEAITEAIGPSWITNLEELHRLEPLADDSAFRARIRTIKYHNKVALADLIAREQGLHIDPASLFDVQVKRIHEYKRQILNVLNIIGTYLRIKKDPSYLAQPRTFLFAGKAAPAYVNAKLTIKLINAVAEVVNHDGAVSSKMRVAFLPNYGVSLAGRIIPAADVSEQISTAGYEASGTGNMKLALNGALTVGTLDGANVEILQRVGHENFFLFGLTAEQVAERIAQGYRPQEIIEADPELKTIVDLIAGGFFAPEQPRLFQPLVDSLVNEDRFLVFADYAAYAACQERISAAYADQDAWTRMAIINTAKVGWFSSDRTVQEYARDIWNAMPVPID
ncbi:MAG: glycogen/starch/alpha-glucan phosphorylase, partial [Pseudomonadota bacterium]